MPNHRRPTAVLKVEGNYRPDRHGDRIDDLYLRGVPQPPNDLSVEERSLWDVICESLPENVLSPADTLMMIVIVDQFEIFITMRRQRKEFIAANEIWQQWRARGYRGEHTEEDRLNPPPSPEPLDDQFIRRLGRVKEQLMQFCSRFGMSPADRSKIVNPEFGSTGGSGRSSSDEQGLKDDDEFAPPEKPRLMGSA